MGTPVKVHDIYGPHPVFVEIAVSPQFPDMSANLAKMIADKKAEEERRAAEEVATANAAVTQQETVTVAPVAPVAVSGGCLDWIGAAGIADTANAMTLINRESGCNPFISNSSSGACGVAQELPCGKSGCVLGDGRCQVAWMNKYVLERYGSWANAVGFHNSHNWY